MIKNFHDVPLGYSHIFGNAQRVSGLRGGSGLKGFSILGGGSLLCRVVGKGEGY